MHHSDSEPQYGIVHWAKLCFRWLYPEAHAVVDKEGIAKYLPKDMAARTITTKSVAASADITSRRFVKSHLPLSMNNPRLLDTCKVVYVARNPKDMCVSFYNHNRLMATHGFTGNLEVSWPSPCTDSVWYSICLQPVISHLGKTRV